MSLRDADAGWFQGLAPVLQWGIVSTLIRSWLQYFPRAVGGGGRQEAPGEEQGAKSTNWNRFSNGCIPVTSVDTLHWEIFWKSTKKNRSSYN